VEADRHTCKLAFSNTESANSFKIKLTFSLIRYVEKFGKLIFKVHFQYYTIKWIPFYLCGLFFRKYILKTMQHLPTNNAT